MSRVLATIAIEDAAVEPLGVKEALVMAVEHLGGVQVLSVEVQEPRQSSMRGWPENRHPPKPPSPLPVGQASASPAALPGHFKGIDGRTRSGAANRPKRSAPNRATGCFNCVRYQRTPGLDDAGQVFYVRCALSGQPVYKLFEWCESWVDAV